MTDDSSSLATFDAAWASLSTARTLRRELDDAWGDAVDYAFDGTVPVSADGAGELWLHLDHEAALDRVESLTRLVAQHVRVALDAAVLTTASLVSGAITEPDEERTTFPLCATRPDFLTMYESGALDGTRPDHNEFLEMVQPYMDKDGVPAEVRACARSMAFLLRLTTAADGDRVVGAWAHLAEPVVSVDSPHRIVDVVTQPAGLIADSHCVATFTVTTSDPAGLGDRPGRGVRGNPNVALDLVETGPAAPPPADDDDTLGVRVDTLLNVAVELVQSLERSLGLRDGPLKEWSPANRLPSAEAVPWGPLPTRTSDVVVQQARATTHASPVGIATMTGEGSLTLFVASGDHVFARPIAAATALDPRLPQGAAAEGAVATAASTWGIPDFVFPPTLVHTGSGIRELGDGIVYTVGKGLVLQVKSRHDATVDPVREAKWVHKQVTKASKQAAGTVRRLCSADTIDLTNQRGRDVTLKAAATTWVGIVIIDHPDPPEDVLSPPEHGGLPIVVLLRRDWEFLFSQLGSAGAVVSYLHRVAADGLDGDVVPLGDEPGRYFDLARKDEDVTARANSEESDETLPAYLAGATHKHVPLLPMTPADHGNGGTMFRYLLDDIATSPMPFPEHDRLEVLSALEDTEVAHQRDIGELLLQALVDAHAAPVGSVSWRARWVISPTKPTQTGFGVFNNLSESHRDVFRSRLMLQHHRLTQTASDPEHARTVGVLLTPNYLNRRRLWDTTMYALTGPSTLTDEEASQFANAWEQKATA